jgi:GMP synthase (glutamine-hydrolysing)
MSRTVLVVEHQQSCPPALVGEWLEDEGVSLRVVRPYLGEPVPSSVGADGLLVMGGSMGANDDDRAPWLPATRQLIRTTAEEGTPSLGICLGHQLMAVALGGEVTRNPKGQTVGARAVTRVGADDPLAAALPAKSHVPQWNDDVVAAVPEGTVAVAVNDRDDLLMARYAPTLWGIQGHPEATPAMLGVWAAKDVAEGGLTGATEEEVPAVLAELEERMPEISAAWRPVVAAWAGLLSRP